MNIKKHFAYYISLVLILFFGFLLVMQMQDRTLKTTAALFTAFIYIIWGLIHHSLNHDLNRKIVVEYVLMGALGAALILLA